LRKQRPEPSESVVDATQEPPERQLRRQAVMPTKNCSVVISGGRGRRLLHSREKNDDC
jgi:hypothetical protein